MQRSLADRYEDNMLELLRVWEPLNSSGALLDSEAKDTKIVFLMETKLRKEKMDIIRCKLGLTSMFVVDSVRKS